MMHLTCNHTQPTIPCKSNINIFLLIKGLVTSGYVSVSRENVRKAFGYMLFTKGLCVGFVLTFCIFCLTVFTISKKNTYIKFADSKILRNDEANDICSQETVRFNSDLNL